MQSELFNAAEVPRPQPLYPEGFQYQPEVLGAADETALLARVRGNGKHQRIVDKYHDRDRRSVGSQRDAQRVLDRVAPPLEGQGREGESVMNAWEMASAMVATASPDFF